MSDSDAKRRNDRAARIATKIPGAVLEAAKAGAVLDDVAMTVAKKGGYSTRVQTAMFVLRAWHVAPLLQKPELVPADSVQDFQALCEAATETHEAKAGRAVAVVLNRIDAGDNLSLLTRVVEAAKLAEPDTRPNVLLGASLDGDIDPDTEAMLLELGSVPPDQDPATLFDMAPPDDGLLVPSYLLQAYDLSGGPLASVGRGGPAPVRQRIWLDALTMIVTTDRTGDLRRFNETLGDMVDRWWPYGWDYQRDSWATLVRAFVGINAQRFAYHNRAGVLKACHMLVFTDYPLEAPSPKGLRAARVRGVLTQPEGNATGPSISRWSLQHSGTISGEAQRVVATWAFYRGRYLSWTNREGCRRWVAPTLPLTQQDGEGRYLDTKGCVILDKRGKPITRWSDPRVVMVDAAGVPVAKPNQAARIRNPQLDRAPAFTLDMWRSTTRAHPATDKQIAYKERQRLKAAFTEVEAASIFGVEQCPGGTYRLIPPGTVGRSPSKAELLADHERRVEEARKHRRDRSNRKSDPRLFDEG